MRRGRRWAERAAKGTWARDGDVRLWDAGDGRGQRAERRAAEGGKEVKGCWELGPGPADPHLSRLAFPLGSERESSLLRSFFVVRLAEEYLVI